MVLAFFLEEELRRRWHLIREERVIIVMLNKGIFTIEFDGFFKIIIIK